ncbi:MAG: protein kinase [Archangium sp.]|nr:protein kinase [Archangium sp.]
MAEPFQPIPESTQVHVDRLLGIRLGEVQVLARVAEGRYGSLYAGSSGDGANARKVLIEVLRAGRHENENDVRAVNSIGAKGVVNVLSFGEVPDGRFYRVMEWLDGESLDQQLQKHGKMKEPEVIRRLEQVAEVLEAAHAWAIPHGALGASSVFVVKDAVRVIDFGLIHPPPSAEDDQRALGALGFALLLGKELEGAPPPVSRDIDDSVDRLLREMFEKRLKNMSEVRKELKALLGGVENTVRAAPKKDVAAAKKPTRAPLLLAVAAIVILVGGGAGFLGWQSSQTEETPADLTDDELLDDEEDALDDQPEVAEPSADAGEVVAPNPAPSSGSNFPRPQKPPPSAQALQEQVSKLERTLRDQTRPGDDIDQALYVLNKQRLRLTGNPTLQDRKDVARQLAGWKRSYLKKKKK